MHLLQDEGLFSDERIRELQITTYSVRYLR
jgi:hypothetical protein